MEILKGLFTPKQGPRIRFRAMTESYDLIDSWAERVDTQLIVHSDGVAIRDRQPVTLYKLLNHDSMPSADCSIIVETGLFRKPEARSRWVLQESLHIWLGYAEGTLQAAKAKLSFDPNSLRGMSLVIGGTVFGICIVAAVLLSALGGDDQPSGPPAQDRQTAEQGADHGWVDPEGESQNAGESENPRETETGQ